LAWLAHDEPKSPSKEVDMFARLVSMRLRPNYAGEFTRTIEKEVLPLLEKQQGFQDAITFVVPEGTQAIGISLWDNKEDAESYNLGTYPEVLKALAKVIKGTPKVKTFEVANSTFHKIAARAAGT
jgi:heme-degrading monooxygenase HmoA